MRAARPIGFAVAALLAWPAAAQVVVPAPGPAPVQAAPSAAILTLDQEALYRESLWGKRAQADLEARSRAISAENDRIAAQLEAEDDALTALRATLPEDEFRRRADAFDAKVQKVRQDRDQAGRDLLASADTDRTAFLNAALPVLTDLMRERGAVALLDRRTVLLSIDQIDVTAALIARIDAALGEGPVDAGTVAGQPNAAGDPSNGAEAPIADPQAGGVPARSGTATGQAGAIQDGLPANGAAPAGGATATPTDSSAGTTGNVNGFPVPGHVDPQPAPRPANSHPPIANPSGVAPAGQAKDASTAQPDVKP